MPRGVVKEVREMIDGVYDATAQREQRKAAAGERRVRGRCRKSRSRKGIKRLEKQMFEHAKNLEFEKAARVRDQLALLQGAGVWRGRNDQRRAAGAGEKAA